MDRNCRRRDLLRVAKAAGGKYVIGVALNAVGRIFPETCYGEIPSIPEGSRFYDIFQPPSLYIGDYKAPQKEKDQKFPENCFMFPGLVKIKSGPYIRTRDPYGDEPNNGIYRLHSNKSIWVYQPLVLRYSRNEGLCYVMLFVDPHNGGIIRVLASSCPEEKTAECFSFQPKANETPIRFTELERHLIFGSVIKAGMMHVMSEHGEVVWSAVPFVQKGKGRKDQLISGHWVLPYENC